MTSNAPAQKWRLVPSEQRFLLVLSDIIAGIIALLLALLVWSLVDPSNKFSIEFLRNRIPLWFYFLPFIWVLLLVDSYDLRKSSKFQNAVRSVGLATAVASILY